MLSNAVIIGAQKCATTSLGHYLAQHPEVCLPSLVDRAGGEHPFDLPARRSNDAVRPAPATDGYNGEKIVLQKRPLWIYEPRYAANIAAYNPNAKIIAVLRNQADRAFAHWRHNIRKGREARAFASALACEDRRIQRNAYFRQHFSYLDRGHFASQLDRYAEHFPDGNILLLTFEQLVREPQETCNRTLAFLGLSPQRIDATTRFNENPFELRSTLLAWPLYALNFVMDDNSRRLHSLRGHLHGRFNLRRAAERPRLDPELKREIMKRFERENAYLAERWGIEIN